MRRLVAVAILVLATLTACSDDKPPTPGPVAWTKVDTPAEPVTLTAHGDQLLIGLRHRGAKVVPELLMQDSTGKRTPIKAALLDRRVVVGVGNIYADEALFRAKIHPLTIAARLSKPRAIRLYDAIRQVLTEAIESRGSSVSDYVDADGRLGSFQQSHRVYQRHGEPCLVCGRPIRRTLVAQRGTHYCAHCQKR